jgi:phage terminase small subunit
MSDDELPIEPTAPGELSQKQLAFVESYLTTWNATEAARRAGYAHPNKQGPRLLVHEGIRAVISARLAALRMSADEVLARLSDQAAGSMADFLRIEVVEEHRTYPMHTPTEDDPKAVTWVTEEKPTLRRIEAIDLLQAKEQGKLHLLKKIKIDDDGIAIELYDAQKALELMSKAHGLFKEDGGILKYLDLTRLNNDQLTRIRNGEDPLAVLLGD